MTIVHLALGSNLGDRGANLEVAIHALAARVWIDDLSAVYETAPMYVTDQPAFLNMAIRGRTDLAPIDLLRFVKRVEASLGRAGDGQRFGPRPIDVDILLYGDSQVALPELEIPHPRLAERAFVLRPLADLGPQLRHPVLDRSVEELLAAVPGKDTVRLHAARLDGLASAPLAQAV